MRKKFLRKIFTSIVSVVLIVAMLSVTAVPVFANSDETASQPGPSGNVSSDANMTPAPAVQPELDIVAHTVEYTDEKVYIKYAVPFDGNGDVKMFFFNAAQNSYTAENATVSADPIDKAIVAGRECLVFRYDLLEDKQMTEYVYARAYVMDGDNYVYGAADKYSVLQYAYNMRVYDIIDTIVDNMIEALLNRGAAAQISAEYRLDDLANQPHDHIHVVEGVLADGFADYLIPVGVKVTGIDRYLITTGGRIYYIEFNIYVIGYVFIEDYLYYFEEGNGAKRYESFEGYSFDLKGRLIADLEFVILDGDTYYFVNQKIVYGYYVIDDYLYYFGIDGVMVINIILGGHTIGEDGRFVGDNIFVDAGDKIYYLVDCIVVIVYIYIDGDLFVQVDGKYVPAGKYENSVFAPDEDEDYSNNTKIPGVECIARIDSLGVSFTTVSDENGNFAFPYLPRLTIVFIFIIAGYDSFEIEVDLSVGDTFYPVLTPGYSNGLVYEMIENSEYRVVGIGTCTDVNIVIPDVYEGLPVTEIGEKAFYDCDNIISVKLPDSIEKIFEKAFADCDLLIKIDMNDTVEIGKDVFRGTINIVIIIKHAVVHVARKEASCTEPGNIEYYWCSKCNLYFADAEQTERLYDVVIPNAHSFVGGSCEKCGKVQDEILVVGIDSVENLGKFALGTLENAIGLPASIKVYTADGRSHSLPVVWDVSTYDKSTVGEYTISGIIQSGEFRYAEGLSNEITAQLEVVDFMKGTADIVFVLDISGSMGDEIANVKNNLQKFAQEIEDMGVSARWSVITYSDFTVSGANEKTTIIMNGANEWYTTASGCKNAIAGIDLAYGGDAPETALDGLMMANTLSTRKDARVFYILLTDAECKDRNNYGVYSLEAGADILAANNVNVSVITETTYYSEYRYLVNTTGGIMTNIYGNFSNVLVNSLVPIIYGEVID